MRPSCCSATLHWQSKRLMNRWTSYLPALKFSCVACLLRRDTALVFTVAWLLVLGQLQYASLPCSGELEFH